VLADDGVAHHYYFLARRLEAGAARVPVIIPRQNRQVIAQVTLVGTERVSIAGEAIDARKVSVVPTGTPERFVWIDAQGRVLRVEIPSTGFLATRVAAPK
jgi:hypothetical protein